MKSGNSSDVDDVMTECVSGKIVDKVISDEDFGDHFMLFKFTDGTELWIRHDYLIEWKFRKSNADSE